MTIKHIEVNRYINDYVQLINGSVDECYLVVKCKVDKSLEKEMYRFNQDARIVIDGRKYHSLFRQKYTGCSHSSFLICIHTLSEKQSFQN